MLEIKESNGMERLRTQNPMPPKTITNDANQDALVGKNEKALPLQQGVILHENIIPIQIQARYLL